MGELKELDDKLGGGEGVKREKKRTAYEDDMGDGPTVKDDEGRKRRKVQETKDKDGLPIVSAEFIVREIWLRGGSCAMKDLVKAFKISKKTPDRTKKFLEVRWLVQYVRTEPLLTPLSLSRRSCWGRLR